MMMRSLTSPGLRPAAFSTGRYHHSGFCPAALRHCRAPVRSRRSKLRVTAEAGGIWAAVSQFRGGADSIAGFLETAPPEYYLLYLLSAGLGLPCSEDALNVWIGSRLWRGLYGGWQQSAYVLGLVYIGVVVSDYLTFGIGLLLRMGFLKPLRNKLLRDPSTVEKAEQGIQRWSKYIGVVQRFSLGFRGPLCLISGFTGVSPTVFATGAAIGALGTLPIQLTAGYFLRQTPNVYLTTLALVAVPNLIGNYVGPLLLAAFGAVRMNAEGKTQSKPQQ